MKPEFNRYERIAGIFVIVAIIGIMGTAVGVAVKKGWFASKRTYHTYLKTASGLHSGTVVQMSGLKAGWVDYVELLSADKVKVTLEVFEEFAPRIRTDSHVQVIRPYLVGEKVVSVSIGSESLPEVGQDGYIPSKSGIDIVDLLSGRLLGPLMGNLERLVDDVRVLVAAIDDKQVQKTLDEVIEQTPLLISNMNDMSQQMALLAKTANDRQRFAQMLDNTNAMSREFGKIADQLNEKERLALLMDNAVQMSAELGQLLPLLNQQAPDTLNKMPELLDNLLVITSELRKLTPVMAELAPEMPHAGRRTIEAIDEAVILMKALQKSFLLKGKVKEVRKEEE